MKNILLMNMSGVCINQEMFKANAEAPEAACVPKSAENIEIMDCRGISGTDCYCDDTAAKKLEELIKPYRPKGLHYIDSGNYHYLSKLWTDKIDKAFDLVVFDHHPDMQPPAFGPILSCGSWIKDAIEVNPNLKNVYVIGVNAELITEEMRLPDFAGGENAVCAKVHFITKQMLAEKRKISGGLNIEEIMADMEDIAANNDTAEIGAEKQHNRDYCWKNDIYISIDKDVLSENEYKTNWDQGDMAVEELLEMLELICSRRNVIGIDVCGEMDLAYAQENSRWNITNNRVNNRLMHFINYLEKNWDNTVDNNNV